MCAIWPCPVPSKIICCPCVSWRKLSYLPLSGNIQLPICFNSVCGWGGFLWLRQWSTLVSFYTEVILFLGDSSPCAECNCSPADKEGWSCHWTWVQTVNRLERSNDILAESEVFAFWWYIWGAHFGMLMLLRYLFCVVWIDPWSVLLKEDTRHMKRHTISPTVISHLPWSFELGWGGVWS